MIDQDTGEIIVPFLRTANNYDRNAASKKSGLATPEPTRAQQQFKEECDINTIVQRFGLTGELPQNFKPPLVEDFDQVMDYQSALNAVIAADRAFMEIPAATRQRFNNNPQQLLEFLDNPANTDEARKLGLLRVLEAPPQPLSVRVIADPPAEPK